jgi:hypothetical protein
MFSIILRAAICLLLSTSFAISQTENGQIFGQVTDEQGLAVSGAVIEIVNQDTLTKRKTKTNETGS